MPYYSYLRISPTRSVTVIHFKLYLYCLELSNIKLHWMSKLWYDGHNLDPMSVDLNMYSEDKVS